MTHLPASPDARPNPRVTEPEAALYERFASRVYFLALRDSGSTQDAEDVRAETFLRVFQAIRSGQVHSPVALPAFILGVARNVLLELFAKRRRAGPAVPAETVEPAVPSHEGAFVDRDVRRAVHATLAQLKPRDRAVLRMCFYEDLPTAEIARRLGIAPDRVRLVKSRALKRFRDLHHLNKSAQP